MKLVNIFLILSSLAFAWACNSNAKEKPEVTEPGSDAVIPVKLATVQMVERTEPIEVSGLVSSSEEARLGFKTGGIIDRMLVREGQMIRKGQLLATLDMTEIDAQMTQAQIAGEKAERDLSRVKRLYADTAATLEQLQNAQSGSKMASQNLTIASFNRTHSQILSTIDGTIIKKVANEGENVAPGSPVYIISSNRAQDWVIRVGISDKDWTRLRLGNTADISLEAYPTQTFKGTISQLSQAADPATKLYEVEVRVKPGNARFAPGLFAKVKLLPAQSQNYARVPVEAIVEGNGKEGFVYALAAGKGEKGNFHVQKLPVKIGFLDGDKVLITNGLSENDKVISAGSAFLTEQSIVVLR